MNKTEITEKQLKNRPKGDSPLLGEIPGAPLPLPDVSRCQYTGAVLAYIGDAVYEVQVRRILVEKGYFKGNRLHKEAVRRVNAPVQSRLSQRMLERGMLTPEEEEIFKRGRNAKPKYIPKQANVGEYTNSTGLEAVIGYHFLLGNQNRIARIMEELETMLEEEKK